MFSVIFTHCLMSGLYIMQQHYNSEAVNIIYFGPGVKKFNRLKKFVQVGVDVKCMQTNFGGRGLSGFGDIATFKFGQISLLNYGL